MAKRATAKPEGAKKARAKAKSKEPKRSSGERARSRTAGEGGAANDAVDAVIKLLQSPLVIDLLAVGATAALAAITEQRSSSRTEGASGRNSKKVLKAAGKAAAAAVGRRLATEFEEIKSASKRAGEGRKGRAGEAA